MKVVETYDGSGCSKHLGNGFMKSQSFSFSPMPLDFIRPPPAPVFNPTPEEFTDPISYVQRISSIAFNYGICKIRPPNGWKPPFCVDQQNFTFVPRVQELSDVCAYNRVRYHFITSLINFWEAQDVTLFVPQIKGRSIDIYRLWKQVQSTGGYQTVCEKKLWCKICGEIGLPAVPSFASSLSSHYKKYLLPYDTFISDESVNDNEHLEFSCSSQSRKNKPPVEKMVCSVCNLGNDDKYLLLCDGCETYGACHTYCLDPPLSDVPKGNWYCRSCIIRRYKRLNRHEVFGFKSSNVKYTLHTFGIRADDFKAKHFGKPTHMVSLEEAEAEFWRLVGSEDTGVSVEYGADLNAREHGSGFPTSRQGRTSQKSKNYVTSPWNLNNTPLLDNSALRFLPRNISGMIIPWCYVGMAFSCFCWHTEDHWSYSINYLHMGEPKTWYGVPTNYADAFELAMRSEVPELFVNSPDLLHHMTTMVSPSRLQAHGVPVYRTDQMVGEFVVTFPRAFHAGFNQGFNFAEAVNFCPADWLEYGRNCIEHYALLHRTPVFSHAELLCRMAKSVEPLSVEFLTVITKQLGDLLTTERSLRRHLARIGVRLTERMVFENSEDEKRECDLCRTTLYLSSLGCKCSESMVCLAHYQIRTCCPRDSQIMRYRYDLDELTEFKEKLQSKLIEFEQWKNQIENEVFSAMQNPVDTVKLSSALKTATTTNTTTEINHNKSGNNLEQQTDLLKLNNYLKLSICDNVDNSVNNSSIVSSNNTKENDREDIIVDTKLDTDNKNELATVDSKPSSSISLKIDPEQHQKLTLFDLNKLLKLGRSRQYPNTLVERLNYVVHTISECSSVVRKLITSYKNACESMKITQETEMKSLKSESTDSGHEEEDDDHDFENDDDADNDNGASERKEELKQNTNQTVHNILHTSTSSRSSSETDDEVSIEDSRNSTATSFTKNSRRLSSSFHGDDDDNDDYTERLEQREEDKTEVTNQNEQVNVSLRANYRNNNSDNSNNNNNSCRKLRSRSTSCHYASSNRTRNKSSASKGPFISKLTLNEFASLVKLASTLPVILPEYKDLQELADHITRWRSEVRDLLVNLNKKPFLNNNNNGNDNVNVNDDCIISSSISDINTTTNDSSSLCDLFKIELQLRSVLPSVIKVAEYINVGSAIDIELPELNQLKRVHECLTWLEKVDKALNYKSNSVHEKIEKNITITSKPTLSNLCDLQIQGSHVASAIAYVMNIPENAYSSYNFSSHSLLDTVLSIQSRHLLETISTVKLVEEKLNEIIQAKPGSLSLNSVKEQLIIAKQLPIQLTAITNVQLICEKAEKYEKQFELFAKLLLQNVSLSPSSLNEYNRNTFKQEQCCYTEGRQNKKEEEANTADNNGINQCTMDQEILDEVGLGSVNSTPINWQSYFNTLEDNIQDCVIKFPQNDSIRKLLSDLNKFHEKLSKLFIRPQSTRSLLEILLPRSASALEWLIRLDGDPDIIPDSYRNNFNLDANNCPPTTYKRHTRSPHFQSLTYKSLCKDHVQEFAKISNVSDWEQMYNSTYNRFVEAEVSLMHYLRSTNMRKSRAKNQEKIVYCICRQPGLTSFMLQCELCRDWVHGRCVTLPALKDSETERMRYICPRCECSLRPDLKQVFNFVSELNNLFSCNNDSNHDQTVNSNDNQHERSLCFHQFPEFVAVQLLCYRAISFIKHIQKSIASNTELKQALSDYEHFSNMTMPSINLIEENISEELMSSSNCNDTSQIPTNSKKIYLPTKGTSPLDLASSSKSSLGSDRRSSNTTVRSIISHSQDYLDTDFAKTQTLGSYLPTSRPRAGNISMPAKSPWKVMNSTMSKMEMSANRNPREFIIPDEMRSSSSSSRLSNLELQFSSYKQGFKSQSLGSDSTVCTHSGELKETEAAEALAGLSASLNSQSSIVQKQDLSLSSVYNRHSYSNFKTDISFGQLGSRSNLSGKIMNQRDVGFSPCSTDRSDSMHFNKLHHGPLLSPNHIRDLCNVNRLGQSKIPTTDLETTRKTSCLQSTRKFYFPLSAEARKILENLIMEACLLEVHLPQTRWLWQLHLASDQETESCGAYHPFVAKIEEERLKRRILRHIQQSNQSKLSERFRAGRRKRRGSGSVGNFVNVLNKNMEHSDDSNISLTENSELQKRQRHSPIYSEAEEKQSGSSSVSDPITHPTLIPRRKAYRLRGRASDLTIARRYKMGRPRRLLPVRSRRSVQRPSHAIGYRSMRSTEQKHFYNPTMRNVLQQECHTMLSNSKQCKMPTNRRARNLSGQLCMASRRTGRVYRGERLVRRLHAFSNNEYSDSSTSEEHLETTPTNEQYHSRHGSIPYRKMTSGYFSYSVGRKRSAFRHARLSGIRSTMAATKTMLNNDESEDENVDCATDDQASNYEDDECPAGPCLHPQTGTVKWVQCEACCRWYHQICVGIHHHFQLPKVYFCPTCHQRATHGLTVRRKQLPTVKNFSRLPSERFPDKHPSKLHLRTKATAGSPLKLGSHLSRRPVGWTTKSAVLSPRLPKLRPYNGPEVSNVLDDDYDDDNDKSNNNTTEEKDVNSTLNQDIPVLTSQLVVDNWCDISQSSEEPSIKIPVSSPRESVHMDEPPVIDAYEHVPNSTFNFFFNC
ncbi:unnamed protein product [Schistosoma rodhaini]|uniref:[histone H3]-trimethyl-L-lysine(4) demethylase n=1 Tax=Schistosoma rodhaini TaxID=6188 RepID=A0AA85FUE3_9TREM|nr:unnamed protein product [Schistosoma rodhaini]